MAPHSSTLAWRIPGTGEPGRRPSMGSHRVGHDWSDLAVAVVLLNLRVNSQASFISRLWATFNSRSVTTPWHTFIWKPHCDGFPHWPDLLSPLLANFCSFLINVGGPDSSAISLPLYLYKLSKISNSALRFLILYISRLFLTFFFHFITPELHI